jgi:Tfp pilus assembly protein PilF
MLSFQDEVAQKVVEALRVQLSSTEEQGLAAPLTASPEAYSLYLLARYYWSEYFMQSRRESLLEAQRLLEQAVAADPRFAEAHALLGFFCAMESANFTDAGDKMRCAEQSARRALRLSPRLPEALVALGLVQVQQGRLAEGIGVLRQAREGAPNWELALDVLSYAYHYAGLNELAEQAIRRCRELNPTSLRLYWMHGRWLLYLGRVDEAVRTMREAVAAAPDQHKALGFLGKFLYYQGRLEEAEEVLTRARALEAGRAEPGVFFASGFVQAARGERAAINPRIFALRPEEVFDGDHAYWAGAVQALLGEKAQALVWLRRAVELGNHNYPWFQRDKNYDSLRGEPEYQAIMAEVRRYWERYRELFGRG